MNSHVPQSPSWGVFKIAVIPIVVLLLAVVGLAIRAANARPEVVPSSGSGTFSNQNGTIGSDSYAISPSTSAATARFDEQLKEAQHFQDFSPCFDDRGQRIGERAAMWMYASDPKSFWRIVWTERRANYSAIYWVEADTLEGAKALEQNSQVKWRLCKATK